MPPQDSYHPYQYTGTTTVAAASDSSPRRLSEYYRAKSPEDRRPSWDQYFDVIAKAISARATCPRANVGAVLVDKDNRIVSSGYNGAPSQAPSCFDVTCRVEKSHCQTAIHAEINAVVFGDRERVRGSRLYLYSSRGDISPCNECQKVLTAAGVTWIR